MGSWNSGFPWMYVQGVKRNVDKCFHFFVLLYLILLIYFCNNVGPVAQ